MSLKIKAILGLCCVLTVAACAPGTTEIPTTPTAEPTGLPTNTLEPSPTPQPSPTVPLVVPTDPLPAGTPGADATAAAPSGANPGVEAANPPAAATRPAGAGAAGSVPDKYTYLGQDIPDRSQFLPNRALTITWTIKNTGMNAWTKEYALRHFAGPKPAQDVYYFSKDVAANETINFTVTFTTPADPGEYDIWFKLTNAAGQNFGDLDLVFTVTSSPTRATSTPSN